MLRLGPVGVLSLAIVIFFIGVAVTAPWTSPHDPLTNNLADALRPPVGWSGAKTTFLLGTDQLGRDVLSRGMFGARTSLEVAIPASIMSLILGTFLGLLTGLRGGLIDVILMRAADTQLSIPLLLVAISILGLTGGASSPTTLIIVLGYWGWPEYARMTRAGGLELKEREFIVAARSIGCGPLRIAARHILPNIAHLILVLVAFQLPHLVLVEASLSFLGLGIPPPHPSWGNMLSESRIRIDSAPWLALVPGAFVALTILSFNLLGERMREVLDPRLRGGKL